MDTASQLVIAMLGISIAAILGIGGVTFRLVLQRMNKQEERAALDIATLRTEIATTKSDANNAVNNATIASNAAAVTLQNSVAATALAAKEQVAASASALKDQVASTATASKESITEKAGALNDRINVHDHRIEKLEEMFIGF